MDQSGFNKYAAGAKHYGASGSIAPTMGTPDMGGYADRDNQAHARRNAVLKQLQAGQQGNFMSAQWLGGPRAGMSAPTGGGFQ